MNKLLGSRKFSNLRRSRLRINFVRNREGRYVVTLPLWSEFLTSLNLGFFQSIVLSQFIRSEARLLKSPKVKSQYDSVIEEYSTLSHLTRVSAE